MTDGCARVGIGVVRSGAAVLAVPPAAPASTVVAAPPNVPGIQVTWSAVPAVTGYRVYYGVGSATAVWPPGDRLLFGTTSTIITGLLPSTTYTLYVVAVSGTEMSAPGPVRTATTAAGACVIRS